MRTSTSWVHARTPRFRATSSTPTWWSCPTCGPPFTESLDPIKAYECVAVGRPTVATPVAGFRDLGGSVVVAEPAVFPAAVDTALRAGASSVLVDAGGGAVVVVTGRRVRGVPRRGPQS